MQEEIVGIRYKQNSKIYYFSPKDLDLSIGDEVLVDTSNGTVIGTVAMEKKLVPKSEIEEPLRSVIRKVTDKDRKQIEKIKRRAQESYSIVESKINSLGLPMKVTDIEYTFDEGKVTISYTSDDRVDFRELLKLLASALRVKIELRQISTREEVKSVGALGLCGRECCCTKFLNEPAHVVVKMAKIQNLSMSPTKTGGACGRMMCCLSYEEPFYKEMLGKMPKVGSKIKTPDGEGVVQYNNLLSGMVTIKVFEKEDSYKVQEYSLQELGIEEKESEGEIQEAVEITQTSNEVSILLANDEPKEYNELCDNENVDDTEHQTVGNVNNIERVENRKNLQKDKKEGRPFNNRKGFNKKFSHFKNNKNKGDKKNGIQN